MQCLDLGRSHKNRVSLFYEECFILRYICVLIIFNSRFSQKRTKKLTVPVLQSVPVLEIVPQPVTVPQPVPLSEPVTASIAVPNGYDINSFRQTTLSDW
jgi:hypothetical protein